MEYQIVTLFLIAILNSVFGYFVVRGNKGVSNTLFSLVTLGVSMWALNLAFFIKATNLDSALLFANLYYISAASIPLVFFYFSLIFPNENSVFKKKYYLFITPLALLAIGMLFDNNIIVSEIFNSETGKDVILNKTNYLIYGSYFLFFVILSYYHLLKTIKKSKESIEKTQLKFVIWGTSISYILGMLFNLFLPWFDSYEYIWLGPPFTLIMVISIGYAIIKHHLFNEKVIATEILTFSLIFFILIRTIISETLQEQLINGVLLLVVTIVGILLIRSVIKEVETREKIEKLAEELKHANVRLKKLDKQKSEFVSMASHQLRAPIASLKGYSSMILEGSYGPVSSKVKEVVARLFTSSDSLAFIINDFLNLSRIERGKIEYSFSKNNVETLLETAVNQVKPSAKENGLKLSLFVNTGNYEAIVDGEKLNQTFLNIINNSIKYTPKGSIDVKLSTKEKKIFIEISDTGIGIAKEDLSKLFKKFARLDHANSVNVKGTGLGLFLAKEIITAHKGKVWVESEGEGKGSTFFIELKKG